MTEDWSEKIFDSLLAESLTEQHPPDLSKQILARWQEELRSGKASSGKANSTLVASTPVLPPSNAPLPKHSAGDNVVVALPVARATEITTPNQAEAVRLASQSNVAVSSDSETVVTDHRLGSRAIWATVLGLAAAVGLCLTLWRNWQSPRVDGMGTAPGLATIDKSTPNRDPLNVPNSTGNSNPKSSPDKIEKPALAGNSDKANATKREVIDIDNLPFATPASQDSLNKGSSSVRVAAMEKLEDPAVVDLLNRKLVAIWNAAGIPVPKPVDASLLDERISATLIGTSAPVNSAGLKTEQYVNQLVRSGGFAEAASANIVRYWMRGSSAAQAEHPDSIKLSEFVSQQIVRRVPWNKIVAQILGSQPNDPQSAFLKQFAGGGDNHRLVERIGQAMLDENLRCARCHDASDDGRVISMDQSEYWSMVALFRGIEMQTDDKQRSLVDRQPELLASGKYPSVFFERPDGRLQSAQVRLPSGAEWKTVANASTPRSALAQWVAESESADRAAVNLAWRYVFGRPLVAQHSALESSVSEPRRDLLDSLAAQFAAHDRDIAKLVGWIVLSQAFSAPELSVSRQQWLLASDAQIEQWRNSQATFALFDRPPVRKELGSLERSLAAVVRWGDSPLAERTRLAQPNPADAKKPEKKNSNTVSGDSTAPVEFLILGHASSASQKSFVSRLTASKLSWEQQVAHVAGMIGESDGTPTLKTTAEQVLAASQGNKQEALEKLLFGAIIADVSK